MKTVFSFKRAIWLSLLACLIFGGVYTLFYGERSLWPRFQYDALPEVARPLAVEPEVIVVAERDYGYRLGDVVPVTIYILQKPGTRVDPNSLALEANFELLGEARIKSVDRSDGGKILRADIRLQSFDVAPVLALKANMSYRIIATNEDKTVTLPAWEAHTSNTWDGRKVVQEGPLAVTDGGALLWDLVRMSVCLFAAWFMWRLYRHFKGLQPLWTKKLKTRGRYARARKQFDRIWAEMENDPAARNAAAYARVSRLVRILHASQSKTTREVEFWVRFGHSGPTEHLELLQLCDRVIYHHEVLSADDHQRIKTIFDRLVPVSAGAGA